jgi:hypothetical protein
MHRHHRPLLLLVLWLLPGLVLAIGAVTLGFDRLSWQGGEASGIGLVFDRPFSAGGGGGGMRLEVATLRIAPGLPDLSLALQCQRWRMSATGVGCRGGRLELVSFDGSGRFDADLDGEWQATAGRLVATLRLLPPAAGRLEIDASSRGDGWQLRLDLDRFSPGEEPTLLRSLLPTGWQLQGELDLTGNIELEGSGALAGRGSLAWRDLSFASPDGLQAGERLAGEIGWSVAWAGGGEAGRIELAGPIKAGELYIDPLFVAMPPEGATLQLELLLGRGVVELQRAAWRDQSLDLSLSSRLVASGGGASDSVTEWQPQRLVVAVERLELPDAYERYLEPLVASIGPLANLATSGRLAGSLHLEDGEVRSVSIDSRELSLRDRGGLFSLVGVDGRVGWGRDPIARPVDLGWKGGTYGALAFGTAGVHGESVSGSFLLAEPFVQPLLDGALMIDEFRFDLPPGATSPVWSLNAVLTPLSLERLSAALGWPSMGGKLSGVIPELAYERGRLKVGGDLLARVFDGEVLLSGFELDGPLAPVSRLKGDVRLRDIDLFQLTETFSFGSIEGRLEGEVNALELVNWQPVAFDARFATPADDDSRHRISQRAVENISSLGGSGVTAALSRSFVRFFDQFGYDRLGVACRLRSGICRMDGVESAENGYYLVKGGGLPRIDVIGYQREVDWRELIDRLKAAAGTSPAVGEGG